MRFPKEQLAEIEEKVEDGEFPNRSEAIRAAVREFLKEDRVQPPETNPWQKV